MEGEGYVSEEYLAEATFAEMALISYVPLTEREPYRLREFFPSIPGARLKIN
jgi:hypothetical protein